MHFESEINLFRVLSSDYVKRNMEMIKIQAFIMPILFLITGLSLIIVVWLGGIKVIQHEMNLGQIAAFIVYLGELIWPMIAFGWVTNIIQQAEASMKRLNKIFAEPYEINDSTVTDYSIKEINGKILISNKNLENKTGTDNELILQERHELYKKSRALLKIKEHFLEKLWKSQQ